MDFFQNFQKKLYSSEKRFKHCILTKVRPLHTAVTTPVQTNVISPDISDLGIYVPRPPPEVRLVIFKELGDCDRPVLFDSKCFKKNSCPTTEKYTYVRSPSDWKVLSEMLFGSVGMTQKAASLKIHSIKSPPSLMLSRVLPKECATASLDRSFECSFENQRANSILSRRKANTMPVPLPASTPSSIASSCSSQSGMFHRSDSGISLSSTTSSSYQLNLPSPGYTGSHGGTVYYSPSSLPHMRAHSLPKNKRDSFTSSDEQTPSEKLLRRGRIKIGFAVICEPEPSDYESFRFFFFEHYPIIESHMTVLKDRIEAIFKMKPKSNFNDMMMKALDEFSSRLVMLYSSPRLPEPVWSSLNCPTLTQNHRRVVVASFVADLTRLVSEHNTKQKSFFVSALLTAVLTHHLGWVTTVTPTSPHVQNEDSEEEDHNVLWAQLGDLYGAVGSPTKVCRTVVTGSCHEVVSTFLAALSYFMRSSRVDDVIEVPSLLNPESLGVKELPPLRTVTERMVPCDIDDSEYVCYSLEDQNHDATEEESEKSPSKIPIARSKSSPHKTWSMDGEVNEASSLTRSHSGPMTKKVNRPRTYAIVDPPPTIRRRTFSNKILTQHKSVQSRRRSHDPPEHAVSSPKCRNCSVVSSSSNKDLSCMNVCGSFCMKREVTWSEPATFNLAGADDSNARVEVDSGPCSMVPSSVQPIQPHVERVVNVQRSCVDATCEADRPRNVCFADEDIIKSRPNYLPIIDANTSDGQEAARSFNFKEKHNLGQASEPSRSKLGKRRQNLPFLELSDDSSRERPASAVLNYHKLKVMRIPSVEMNHTQFDECFDGSWPTLFEVDQTTPSCDKDSGKEPVAPPSVTSCPDFTTTFSDLRQQLDSVKNNASVVTSSMYPVLPSKKGDAPVVDSYSPAPSLAYPRLPSSSSFDSVSFVASSEQVSFNRKADERPPPDLPGPRTPTFHPSPSRLNSVQSSRTVTITEESSLTELPMPGIDVAHPGGSPGDQDGGTSATGFATLMADFQPDYMGDFILHGTPNHPDLHGRILADLEQAVKNSTLDEPVSESVCIVADTDNWSVKVYSSHRLHSDRPSLPALNSKLVCCALHRFANMSKLGISPDFCMRHLENELSQLVLKSRVLAEYTRGQTRIKMGQLSAALSIESQDLPLLMSIASCHSPHVARMMI